MVEAAAVVAVRAAVVAVVVVVAAAVVIAVGNPVHCNIPLPEFFFGLRSVLD